MLQVDSGRRTVTFSQAKAYLRDHTVDLRHRIKGVDPLCTTIAVLLEMHLEDPSHLVTIGILTQAVREYKETCEFYQYYTAGKPNHIH
jgi:hypothetical protein